MKFKIVKNIYEGKYYVHLFLDEYNDSDKAKAKMFGIPQVKLREFTGNFIEVKITDLENVIAYGFFQQKDADAYREELKKQLLDLKNRWENLKDDWSNIEVI